MLAWYLNDLAVLTDFTLDKNVDSVWDLNASPGSLTDLSLLKGKVLLNWFSIIYATFKEAFFQDCFFSSVSILQVRFMDILQSHYLKIVVSWDKREN